VGGEGYDGVGGDRGCSSSLAGSSFSPRPHSHRASPGPAPPLDAGPASHLAIGLAPPRRRSPSSSPRSSSSRHRRSSSSPRCWSSSSPSPPPGSSLSLSISSRRRSSPHPRVTVMMPDVDAGEEREYDRIRTLLPRPG
jgi:hypothetical protein